jgi:hypothetical protein
VKAAVGVSLRADRYFQFSERNLIVLTLVRTVIMETRSVLETSVDLSHLTCFLSQEDSVEFYCCGNAKTRFSSCLPSFIFTLYCVSLSFLYVLSHPPRRCYFFTISYVLSVFSFISLYLSFILCALASYIFLHSIISCLFVLRVLVFPDVTQTTFCIACRLCLYDFWDVTHLVSNTSTSASDESDISIQISLPLHPESAG